MKASNVNARYRTVPLWLAPCVCLPLLLLFPAKAEPTPHTTTVSVAISAPRPSIAARELPAPAPEAAPEAAPEVATVHVVLTRGHMRLELDLPLDGKVSPTTADEIARMMRCPVSGRTRRIAAGTLALLADVATRFPGHEIEVVSAVRDEPDRTRDGVKHSKHWDGHAIDLIVRDAKLSEVRDAMWKNHRDIGVGWYPTGGFIHLDYRPDVHDTAWTQVRPNADNQYNPRWARLARDPDAQTAAMRAQMRRLLETSPTLSTLVTSIAEAFGYSDAGIVRDHRNS
jgi:uncharacterized protein YcbK (DUF882 family)